MSSATVDMSNSQECCLGNETYNTTVLDYKPTEIIKIKNKRKLGTILSHASVMPKKKTTFLLLWKHPVI